MARLTRVTNKIFGDTASIVGSEETGAEIGQFGSAKIGTYNATSDVAEIQGLTAWNKGWIDAVIPNQQYPTLPEMTGVNKVITYQLGYLHQEGVSEYDENTVYYIDSLCKYTPIEYEKNVFADIGESTGITGVTVDAETFLSQITNDGDYVFTYNGANWLYNDTTTNLSLYGIVAIGTPAENDEITVTEETIENRGECKIYKSMVSNNVGNPITDERYWVIFTNNVIPPTSNIQQYIFPYTSISGLYDNATGYPDLISYSGSTASFKVSDYESSYIPLKVAYTDGTIKDFVSIADLDVSALANGTYNLYIDKDGVIYPYANNEYASRIVPAGGTSTIVYVDKFDLSNNLSKVGNPTINATTGALSGMDSSNYMRTPSGAQSYMSNNNWEIQVKFKYSQTYSNPQLLIGNCYLQGGFYGCNIYITASGKLKINIRYGNSATSWESASALSTNTDYTVNVKYDGTKYTATGGGINQTLTTSTTTKWASNYPLYMGHYYSISNGMPAKYVTIDLMNTYVKSGGDFVISNVIKEKEVITTGGSLSANDIWLDTSVKPYVLRQYDGSSAWSEVDYVRLPQQITVSGGAVSGIVNILPYNANGWDEQLSTPDYQRQTTLTKGVQFTTLLSGYVYNSTENVMYYLDRGYSYTPDLNSSGTWYFSPLKGE